MQNHTFFAALLLLFSIFGLWLQLCFVENTQHSHRVSSPFRAKEEKGSLSIPPQVQGKVLTIPFKSISILKKYSFQILPTCIYGVYTLGLELVRSLSVISSSFHALPLLFAFLPVWLLRKFWEEGNILRFLPHFSDCWDDGNKKF